MTFQDLGICKEILNALTDLGFTNPTLIQEKSIPALLADKVDYIGLAQTGTGKTAAFGVPLITKIDATKRNPQGLVLCPTRELCLQIVKELQAYSKYIPIDVVAIYGGASIEKQIDALRRSAQIVVGTPGRVIDLLNRGVLKLGAINTVVLDEADEMLNMGFQKDIDTILSNVPTSRNTWLFSATMPQAVGKIAQRYMKDPVQVTVGSKNAGARNIVHHYSLVARHNQYEAIRRFIDFAPNLFGMLFCRTKRETQEIAEKLTRDGYSAEALHGDLSQTQRDFIMAKFRNRKIQLLVATDVAARGIDVNDITHVIHHNIPEDIEVYTHRSGRTARAGKSGISWTVITNPRDIRRLKQVEGQIGLPITLLPVPHANQIQAKQLEHLALTIRNQESIPSVELAMQTLLTELGDIPHQEIVNKLCALYVGNKLEGIANLPDINNAGSEYRSGRDLPFKNNDNYQNNEKSGLGSYAQNGIILQFNIGSYHGIDKGRFLNFICTPTNISSRSLGKIEIQRSLSFVVIENEQMAQKVQSTLQDMLFNNRKVAIERASRIPRDIGARPSYHNNKPRDGSHSNFKGNGEQRTTPYSMRF